MTEGFPRKFGKYYLLQPLAQGGMGALYLAVAGDRGLEKLCVIKTVLPHLADAEYVARFRDEAKVVVKLSHGNLVPVFDAGQVGGEIFLAMDFVEGKDLRAVWNRCAKKAVAFPVDVAVHIVKELCRGLAYAHSFAGLKLVHRDVSPPNVLVSFAGEVKLTDFGLASSTLKLEKTAPGVIYGKVSYMSPEQARGEPLDGRTDLYAAGIILWELLTGRQLFPPPEGGKGNQPADLIARAKDPAVDPPSKRAPRVPPALDAIVLKALAPNPNDRFQSGEEMRAALAEWIAREAPATDAARIEKFVTALFAEDIVKERAERDALVLKTRERIRTLPSSEELKMKLVPPDDGTGVEVDVAQDAPTQVELRSGPVRSQPPHEGTRRGMAVPVPSPGPGGATIVPTHRPQSDSGAQAALAPRFDDSDSSADVIGKVIDGRYLVRSLIGEGGMGRVYEAEHIEIGKRVALKILHPVYSRTPEVVARFRREARAASKIGHPNIVDVTDSGTTEDGSVFFVMEYLEGVELAAVISREGALDIHRALNIGTQICRALAAAHNAGIIHRDLKPENVFLVVREGTTDFVKVLDFGIAKSAELEEQRTERLTHPGMAMGTPEYMAPEQAAGKPADARSDVYAVGAILFEMLTGVPPYEGENFMEILTKKATTEPQPPRELRPELPEVIERVILRALARDPNERPRSMEALEYELTKCLAGRGVAVAKVLGMPLDAALATPLGPVGDAGPLGAAPSTAPPAMDFSGPAVASSAAPVGRSSGQVAALTESRPPGAPVASAPPIPSAPSRWDDLSQGTEIVSVRPPRSRGWLVGLLLVTAAGGAAAWYAFLRQPDRSNVTALGRAGERPGEAAPVAPSASPTASPAGPERADPERNGERSGPDRARRPEKPPERPPDKGEKPVERALDKPSTAGRPERPPEQAGAGERPAPVDRSSAPPRDRKEARALLARAKAASAKLRWAEARALYERVAKGKFERAEGLLGLANVAWQTKDVDTAIVYAKQALDAGAGDAARLILGHSYYKKGRYTDAIAMYKMVLKNNPNNREAKSALRDAEKQLQGP